MKFDLSPPSKNGVPVHAPRRRIHMSDAQIVHHFRKIGYGVRIDQIAFTNESVSDFVNARDKYWSKVGTIRIYEDPGMLVVEKAQPRGSQPMRDIAVVSLGRARAVMGVMKPDNAAISPRYAQRME